MFEPFRYTFVQQGVLEVSLLALGSGLIGIWLVLRGLAFYSHAVGTAAFPGLVVAAGVGFSAPLGAAGAALVFAGGVELLHRSRRSDHASATAIMLVGALTAGVILASDVFHSGANVETLLFGSLLLIGDRDLALAAAVSLLALAGTVLLGRRWLVTGFDPISARSLGSRSRVPDAVLLALIALAVVAGLTALGALLVTALLVVPAATARLWSRRLPVWQASTVLLTALEGVAGLWLSVELNAPPGAAIAVLAGAVFALVSLAQRLRPLRRLGLAATGVVVLAGLAAGCGGAGAGTSGGVSVVATTTQIADWTRAVGGEAVAVHQILQPNTDPHEYEPRPADVQATSDAEVVFESGDNLDSWMGKVVSQAGGDPTIVDLGARVPVHVPGEESGPEASKYDPHWWHDPRNVEAAVRSIRGALTRADPASRATFARNARRYLRKLRDLDRGVAACVQQVPSAARKLVTDHDAFGYFARRYGIRVVGAVIPSQTTQAQPSAGETARLIELVRREHVHAIFPESSLNPRLAETIARETGATSDYTLYGDTLGPEGSSDATYLGMEEANTDAMMRGFTQGRKRCRIATG